MIHVTLQDLKRLLKVRCFAILFLFFVQLVLSQQSTTSIALNRDTLDLGQKPILLNEVVVSTSDLSAYQLVMESKKTMQPLVKTNRREFTYFLRHSELNDVHLDFELKKSSLEQIDDRMIEQITQSIPTHSSIHVEALLKLTQNDSLGESARLLRGFELEEESSKIDAENLAEFFLEKIEESLSKGNYFKVKSGIFGGKIEENDIDLNELRSQKDDIVQDSIDVQKNHRIQSAVGYQKLMEINKYQPHYSDPQVAVYSKPKRFDFQIVDYTLFKDHWVHVVAFKEKSKAQFYGELWISEEDKALLQFKFINNKPIKSVKLLGIEYSEPRVQGQFLYKKFDDGSYRNYFGRLEQDTKVSIDRPLSFIEKKKSFIGGRKVNRVDLDMFFSLNQIEEYTYILSEKEVQITDNENYFILEKLDSYPSHYWKDEAFSIAPSEAMKNFKKLTEK